ncbi:hypothetical protein HDU97_010328 [Phlyctochytrium planicorne]|nr:hypothetical protein HDU97_010328 [Phlyctochytrium planicorne]
MISFSKDFKERMALARKLAMIFGPLLIGVQGKAPLSTASVNRNVEWSFAMAEILIHAHGLAICGENMSNMGYEKYEQTLLWKLNDTFDSQILFMTPKKKLSPMPLTPQRLAARGWKSSSLPASARRLFKMQPKTPKKDLDDEVPLLAPGSPVSPNYMVGDGSRFTSSLSPLAAERESYRKRLRVG